MEKAEPTLRQRLRDILASTPIVRAYELRRGGIDGKTILRAVRDGDLTQISRGLYQRPDSKIDTEQALAEAAKRVPKGVIARVSALAFMVSRTRCLARYGSRSALRIGVTPHPPIRPSGLSSYTTST